MKNKNLSFLLAGALVAGFAVTVGTPLVISLFIGALVFFAKNLPAPQQTNVFTAGYTPGRSATTRVLESGKATNVTTGEVVSTFIPEISIEAEQEFEIVVQNTHESSAVNDVIVIPFAHDSTAASAVANITLTSSAGSRANTMAFFQRNALYITEFKLQTTNAAAMYSKKIVYSAFNMDGTTKSANVSLSDYRESNGGEILDVAYIKDRPFIVNGMNQLKISTMPASTELIIRLKVAAKAAPQMKAS